MGWFGREAEKSSDSDPFKDLDPSLWEFLDRESPVKYKAAEPDPPRAATKPPAIPSITTDSSSQAPSSQSKSTVPSQSLFPDGRYAHLWKTYRPLSEVQTESKSDQERLQDVFDGYKDRRQRIGRAALENCAEQELELFNCYDHGTLEEKMLLCRTQKKHFNKCYEMQSRFLKALGYLSIMHRDERVDEAIQMHADVLYNRLIAQEKAIEQAKSEGKPIPQFSPLNVSSTKPTPLKSDTSKVSPKPKQDASRTSPEDNKELPTLRPETQRTLQPAAALALRERMKSLNPMEREVEESATVTSLQNEMETMQQMTALQEKIGEDRRRRREEGTGGFMDIISGWLGR